MDHLQHVTLRLECAVVLVTIIISILLPLAFESLLTTITTWTHESWMGSQQDIVALIVLALFLPLLICGSIAMKRTFSPREFQPGMAERFAMLMNALLGLLFLWRMLDAPFSTAIQISGNVLHLSLTMLQLLLAAGVILTAALTYHWVKRFSPLYESLLLKAQFGVVICCALCHSSRRSFFL